jgi:hypothetical protein
MLALPATLYTSRWKNVLFLLFCAGMFVLLLGANETKFADVWWVLLLFGLGVVVFAVLLLPGSACLKLTADGFEVTSLYRKHFVPWTSVDDFYPITIEHMRYVGWNYVPAFHDSPLLRQISSDLSGAQAALPDTYGMSAVELTTLLNELRTSRRRDAL